MSFWYKIKRNAKRNWRGTRVWANDVVYDIRNPITPTYKPPPEFINEYQNKPSTKETIAKERDNAKIIEDIALSMAQLGFEIGFKNKAVGKAARTGLGSYRYYGNVSRRSGVYRQTSRGRSSGAQKYGNRYRTSTYRRN